ncbi:MAG: glycoside hydrolase family 2 TIM barrel-domain containing protein, partial [Actinomycetota bacterium]
MTDPIEAMLPGRPWTDPEATSLNRLPARPLLVPAPDLDTARRIDLADSATFVESPWWQSLAGTWELDHTEAAGTRTSGPVEVPGAWTLQGRDAPHYTNIVMPFDIDPPGVPEANSVGVYRRRVVVPRSWRGRGAVLRIGAAESFHAVAVDGELVGYGTDTRLPSEYDLTGRVRAGRAFELTIVVFRFSAQSWVEDQDQWWHGGLQRSVALWSPGENHLSDVGLVPGLAPEDLRRGPVPSDRSVTGTLVVDLQVDGPAQREDGWTSEVHVETHGGRRLASTGRLALIRWDSSDEGTALVSGTWVQPGSVTSQLRVPGVRAWSAESPTTYRAVVTLRDPAGEIVEVVARRTGFRSVEVVDRELRINGAPVEIHGVNLHEHHPQTGRSVPAATTRRDLELLRAHNLNAVRAAHYPHDEHLAELCDQLGVYLVDEANVESHARQVSLCRDPRFTRTMVERVERMCRRDRNHPSIVAWSLGNESGDGPPQAEAAAFLRRYDPSRPVQYEGPLMHDLFAAAPVTDIVCPMYTGIDELVARAGAPEDQRRPVI